MSKINIIITILFKYLQIEKAENLEKQTRCDAYAMLPKYFLQTWRSFSQNDQEMKSINNNDYISAKGHG